jgi:hypothetical protein
MRSARWGLRSVGNGLNGETEARTFLAGISGQTAEQALAELGMTQKEQQAALGRWYNERIW